MSRFRKTAHFYQLSVLLFVCLLITLGWGISRASANRAAQSPQAQPSLGALLNADGTLDLSQGFHGSLNPQGFQLEYAANGAPRFVPAAPTAGEAWDSQFVNANGAQTFGYAVAVIGTDVYVGGSPLVTVGSVGASGIAKWNGSSWSVLGNNSLSGNVYALAVSGTNLYVGGDFSVLTTTGSTNDIAVWDGSNWLKVGSGISDANSYVLGLAISGSDLYIGGQFSSVSGVSANNIAKWNGSAWSALGSGTDSKVVAVAVSGSNVYAGGEFSTAGGNAASFIALWNGSAWSALGSGVDSFVQSLAVSGTDVYAGGVFSTAGGISAKGIAKWNGSVWAALGSGLLDSGSNPANVRSVLIVGSNIYAAGTIATAGGTPASGIAKWNGSAWSALGGGLVSGAFTNSEIALSIAAMGSDLYVAGNFSKADGSEANRIAKWNGSAWSPLGNTSNSVNRPVYAIAVSGNDVYVGGEFDFAGGVAASNIAKWNGASWSALGSGVNRRVRALAVNGTDVYAGGEFSTAGGVAANFVAKWNGSAWSALGGGITNGAAVTSLAVIGTNLYAGGTFFTAGGNSVSNIARWNGSAWSALGTGLNGFFDAGLAMAVIGTDLCVGGNFTDAGGVANTANIARWNGSAWLALGSGTNGAVRALAVSGSDLYAGGSFTMAGGNSAAGVAKWNGSAWSSLGSGLSGGAALALAATGNDLYAGGSFALAGGSPARYLAKWNGSSWSAPGGTNGIDNILYTLGLQGTTLFAGGEFTQLGGVRSHFFGRYGCVSSLTVNNTGDDADATPGNGLCETATGNGVCTLRAAIQEANALAGCSALTINFSVTGTINTTSVLTNTNPNLTINGPGADQLTVRGAGTHRVFRTSGTANVMLQISGLTFTNGSTSSGGNAGAIEFNSSGGQLTLNACALLGNSGPGQIYSNLSGGLTINNSTIGSTTTDGGILTDRTPITITNSTTSGISFLHSSGTVTVTVLNTTLLNGTSYGFQGVGGSLILKNSIIGSQLFLPSTMSIVSQGNNLCRNASLTPTAPGDLINTDPLLAPVGNYGGPTPTAALLPGSPAINAGTDTGAPTTDQRGIARVGNVDIGAFESRGFTLAASGGNNQSTVTNTAFANPLSVSVSSAFSEPVNGGQVIFTSPGSGPSAIVASPLRTIISGAASTAVIANTIIGGPYIVTATANGATPTVNFSLTNLNSAPTFTPAAAISREQGSPAGAAVTVGSVSDAQTSAGSLTVTQIAGGTATGITVAGITNTNGTITAVVTADCTATSGTVRFQVSDGSLTGTGDLTVNVTANTAPSVTYNNASVSAGGSTTNSPATATDNVSITGYAVQSQGTYTGTISVNASGVVSISAAAPVGLHTITIRATDNCGLTTDATFTLTVGNNPPTITAGAALTRQQGTAGSVSIIATVNDSETTAGSLVVTATTVPAGITITGITNAAGTITATVAASCTAVIGANTVILTVTDANSGTAMANLTVNVTANTVPSVTYAAASVTAGGATTVNTATASDNGSITGYTIVSVVPALTTAPTVNASGVVSITNAGPSGTHTITVQATDNCGVTTNASFVLTVNCQTITVNPANVNLTGGTAGTPYSQSFTVTGGQTPHSFTISAGTLPTGLTLNSSGLLSGTPTGFGIFNFTVKAADQNGCFGERAYTLRICAIISLTASLPAGTTGVTYNQTITASGGASPYGFAVTGGNLPQGLSLNSSGALTGTPTQSGPFTFTVTATDANGCTGAQSYNVTINCQTVTVNPATLANGFVSTTYNQSLTATGGTAPYSFTVSAGTLPAGVNLSSGGALSGTPTAQGTFTFTIRATDANGCSGERGFTVIMSGDGLVFYPLPRPVRILDTRANSGNCDNISTPIAGGTSLTALARLTCEGITIPATAKAITGNLTVLNQTNQIGFLTIYPDGNSLPLAANMIYEPNGILSNNFTVGLSADGKFNVFGERTIDVVADISGYYAPPIAGGLYYHPLSKPIRLIDTRAGQGNCDNVNAPIAGGTSLTTLARVTCEGLTIPATAQAITGNATVINGSGQIGYLTIYPNGVPAPLAANMVYYPGQILSNAFTVSLNASGEFNIFGERTIDMAIDVAGYYSNEAVDANGAGLLLTPLERPLRIFDTRAGQGNCDAVSTPIPGGSSLAAPARLTCEGLTIPNNAQAVIGNATVLNQTTQAGYLTLYPDGVVQPLAANLIYFPNQILSNAFVVGLNSATGQFRIFAERTLDAVTDVSGFFAP